MSKERMFMRASGKELRIKKKLSYHTITDLERWRIVLYLDSGGMGGPAVYYSTIAKWIYGNGKSGYSPSGAEISRIARVAKQEGLQARLWRNGESKASRLFLNRLQHTPVKGRHKKAAV